MNSDIDANLNLDELFKTIERTNHRKNSSDKDALPEQTLKKTWEEEVHQLLKSRYRFDTIVRIILACSTQLLIFGRITCVIIILMNNRACYSLHDSVLIAILGTTTATVIGLALIVLKGFFQFMKQDVDLRDK